MSDGSIKNSDSMTATDLNNLKLARRRTIPTLPKTSEDLIDKLRKFETFTCKREDFLLHAEVLSGKPFVILPVGPTCNICVKLMLF